MKCTRILILVLAIASGIAHAQSLTVAAKVISKGRSSHAQSEVSDVAVWLVPEGIHTQPPTQPITARMTQRNKAFQPRLLILPAGSSVEFPNNDPFFHNVFSLFNGKRFDLGLYEAGDVKRVDFDRPGISYIFCNIHPEMSAVIVTVTTPYYGVTDMRGNISIANVPEGIYELHVFADGLSAEAQKALIRHLAVHQGSANLGTIPIPPRTQVPHKNKYGRDYEAPATAPYEH